MSGYFFKLFNRFFYSVDQILMISYILELLEDAINQYIGCGIVCTSRLFVKNKILVNNVRYRCISIIGKGMSSKVYQVELNNEYYAVKKSKYKNSNEFYSLDKEIDCLNMLCKNPFVIKLLEYEILPNIVYTVFECAPISLDSMMANLKFNPQRIQSTMRQICLAVQSIHQLDVVHKDLKPQNIVFNSRNMIKLIDFGFSELMLSKEIRSDWIEGTLEYMAPECLIRVRKQFVFGIERDVWAVGVIYYEMLFKSVPWNAEDDDTVIDNITGLKSVNCYGNLLLPKLLCVDKSKRCTILEALQYFPIKSE